MKKTVLTFGLIAGVMISVLMGGSLLIANKIGNTHSMLLGYTMMVASFLLIYFGIRSYRDNSVGGQISFGRAFACGILITLITTVFYVAMWEFLYLNFMPHFMDSYFAAQIHKVQASGLDPATTAAQVAAIQHSQQLYQNPFVNMAYTAIEPLPVGIIITLISAAILRKKSLTPTPQLGDCHPERSEGSLFSLHAPRTHEFARGCMAIATSAPIRIAGKSCPTIASAVVIERANGSIGAMSLPIVVSVAKPKHVTAESWSRFAGAVTNRRDPGLSCSRN